MRFSQFQEIFNIQNKFWVFMEKIMNICIILLLWLICSLPLVTIGASTVAAYHYVNKQTQDEEGYIVKSFFQMLRKNFRQSTLIWIVAVGVGYFLCFELMICLQMEVAKLIQISVLMILCVAIMFYIITLMYVFPIVACFTVSTKKAIQDAFIMGIANLPVTFVMILDCGLAAILMMYGVGTILLNMAIVILINSYLIYYVFRKYMD